MDVWRIATRAAGAAVGVRDRGAVRADDPDGFLLDAVREPSRLALIRREPGSLRVPARGRRRCRALLARGAAPGWLSQLPVAARGRRAARARRRCLHVSRLVRGRARRRPRSASLIDAEAASVRATAACWPAGTCTPAACRRTTPPTCRTSAATCSTSTAVRGLRVPRGNVSGCQSCRGQCCRMYTVPLTGHDAFVIATELQLSLEQFAHLLPEPEPTATGVRLAPDAQPGVALAAARDRRAGAAPLRLPRHARRRLRALRHPSAAPVRLPDLSRPLPPRQRRDPRRRAVPARRLEHQRARPSRLAADDAAPGARVDRVRVRRRALERDRDRARPDAALLRLAAGHLRAAGGDAGGAGAGRSGTTPCAAGSTSPASSPAPAFMERVEAVVGSG